MKKYDVIVIGNGPIGLTTALLFAKQNIKVAILCGRKHDKTIHSPARLFAISHGSKQIFEQVNINSILEMYAQSINHIRIVDDNSYAKVDFLPHDIGLENFGYMIDENILIQILEEKLEKLNIDIYDLYENFSIEFHQFFAQISLKNQTLYASLIVAADGRSSIVRDKLGIETKKLDYNQTAIVIDIRHSNWPHNGVAVEKFTPNGPFAILPKHEDNGTTSSLVWVERGNVTYNDLYILNENILKDLVLRKLNDYLGEIELISQPLLYSLTLIQSKYRYKERVVLVGDAAQGVHPIAGQGFNLGLRDVFELFNRVSNGLTIGIDIGSSLFLEEYSKSREQDVQKMIYSTTMLNYLFANDILPVKIMRRLGLKIFDKLEFLKRMAMKYASGI